MKLCAIFAVFLSSLGQASASNNLTFSESRMASFYNVFACEQKDELADVGITNGCSYTSSSAGGIPSDPPPPPFIAGYLPIILVNNSTLPDNEVYVVVTGRDDNNTSVQGFLQFDSNGIGTFVDASPGTNASNYTKTLAELPLGSTGRVMYFPQIASGIIWFSMNTALNMPVNDASAIVQPGFTNPSDSNYTTNYDIFEITYVSTGTNISADATAVSFFSIPLYGYLSTPDSGSSANTGLYQSRSAILASAANTFSAAPNASVWNKLFLKNGATTLRLLSPGKAMATSPPLFDINYLDNAATYGYSYINNIASFYQTHPLKMTIPNGTLDTYTGVINSNNTITFTGETYGYTVIFAAPTTSFPTTSYDIFSALTLVSSDNSPGQTDGIQLSKLFEEAIIAGLIPTANTLSNSYLTSNQSSYYTVNPNLSSTGQATGPWYDLYSKALHKEGSIYTFGFDEPLWPQVLLSSSQNIPNKTYIGITIGSIN